MTETFGDHGGPEGQHGSAVDRQWHGLGEARMPRDHKSLDVRAITGQVIWSGFHLSGASWVARTVVASNARSTARKAGRSRCR
jgi:hypothetical protein